MTSITFPCSKAFKAQLSKLATEDRRTLSAWVRIQLGNTARRSIAARGANLK